VRWAYALALAWVLAGAALYAWQLLQIAVDVG
jgi:hypothetical protein